MSNVRRMIERQTQLEDQVTVVIAQNKLCSRAEWDVRMSRNGPGYMAKNQMANMPGEIEAANKSVKAVRRTKLAELYTAENAMYEERLNDMGLSLRRDR